MFFTSRQIILWGVGTAGLAIIGYAFYFDYKRRTAVDYKNKIRLSELI